MNDNFPTGKAAIAGAIGSAAIAAAMLYVTRRRDKARNVPAQPATGAGSEAPETD